MLSALNRESDRSESECSWSDSKLAGTFNIDYRHGARRRGAPRRTRRSSRAFADGLIRRGSLIFLSHHSHLSSASWLFANCRPHKAHGVNPVNASQNTVPNQRGRRKPHNFSSDKDTLWSLTSELIRPQNAKTQVSLLAVALTSLNSNVILLRGARLASCIY